MLCGVASIARKESELGIADPEQRGGARRFQDHLVAAPAQIGKPRQHDQIGAAERRHLRPVIGNLRFDDDLVAGFIRTREAVFQKTAPRQAPHQEIHFLIASAAATGGERIERQAGAQPLRPIDGAGAELSKADRIAVEAGGEASVRLRFERDGTAQSRGNNRCRGSPRCLFSGSAQADWIL